MNKLKKGDIVGRKSYNKDVIFEIIKIINTSNENKIYILKGLTERIEADSTEEDLEKIDKRILNSRIKELEDKISKRVKICLKDPQYCIYNAKKIFGTFNKRSSNQIYTGKILHLDGDAHLSNQKKCSNINTYKQVIFNHD